MSRAISRTSLLDACAEAIKVAESRYSSWSGGITMRAAPESLVQVTLAELLSAKGTQVFLEPSVRQLMELSTGSVPDRIPRNERGRFDLAIFYSGGAPRIVIEVKKINGSTSLDSDHARIQEVLAMCPKIQCGFIVAYGTAVNAETVHSRLKVARQLPGIKLVRTVLPIKVTGKVGAPRFLGAGVYRVERAQLPRGDA